MARRRAVLFLKQSSRDKRAIALKLPAKNRLKWKSVPVSFSNNSLSSSWAAVYLSRYANIQRPQSASAVITSWALISV